MSRAASRFRAVLAVPGVAGLLATVIVGRLPLGMVPLGILLLMRDGGQAFALAGVVLACYSLGLAIGAPLAGRAADRHQLARVLLPMALASAAATAAVAILCVSRAPVGALCVAAAISGASLPPLGPCMRGIWPRLLPSSELRDSAYALEAILQEVVFVTGPPVVAAVAVLATPVVALLAAAACACLGTLSFVLLARGAGIDGVASRRSSRRALAPAGVRTILAATAAWGGALGAIEVSLPAVAERYADVATGGILLGTLSLGSIAGGTWAGAHLPRDVRRRYRAALLAFAAALLPLTLAGSIGLLLALLFVAGLPLAVTQSAAYSLLADLSVPGAAIETFAWASTCLVIGASVGMSVSGSLVDAAGAAAGLTFALGCATLASLTVCLSGRMLVASDAVR